MSVGLLGAHLGELPIQYEIVPLRPETDGHPLPKEDKREDFAILLLAARKEGIRVHSIGDSAPDKRKEVEDHGRFGGIPKQELLKHIDNHNYHNERSGPDSY